MVYYPDLAENDAGERSAGLPFPQITCAGSGSGVKCTDSPTQYKLKIGTVSITLQIELTFAGPYLIRLGVEVTWQVLCTV